MDANRHPASSARHELLMGKESAILRFLREKLRPSIFSKLQNLRRMFPADFADYADAFLVRISKTAEDAEIYFISASSAHQELR